MLQELQKKKKTIRGSSMISLWDLSKYTLTPLQVITFPCCKTKDCTHLSLNLFPDLNIL